MREGLKGFHQGSPVKGRRCGRIEDIKGLCPDERGAVLQNARRNSIEIYGT